MILHLQSPIKIPSKSKYAKAHAADPVYSLRWNSLHQTLETPLCRFYKVPIPGEGGPEDQGDPRGPKGTQGDPRGPKGAFGALGGRGHGALWGYSVAIPNGKPFRMEGYYERKPLRNESRCCF